jgi:hypothetical protein
MGNRLRQFLIVIGIGCFGLLTPACSDNLSKKSFTDTQVEQARQELFPGATRGDRAVAERAHLALQTCMKKQGYDYDRKTTTFRGEVPPPPQGTYGVTFQEERVVPDIDTGPNGPLSPGYRKAMTGSADMKGNTGKTGCMALATSIIEESIVSTPFVDKLNRRAEKRYLADPSAKELTKSWAPCMAQGGFTFADPSEISVSLEKQLEKSKTPESKLKLQQLERDIFAQDQTCQAPFIEELTKVKRKYETEVARDYLSDNPGFVTKK